jgi:hypothetical protein
MGVEDGPATPSVRPKALAVAVIVGFGALLPALVTVAGGGFGIARNDDYAFLATTRVFAEHGTFQLRGPADMMLIGQVLLAWPVARLTSGSTTALQLTTLAVGTVGLLALAALARNVLDLKRSVLVAVAVAATPLWTQLATTFMTDVWAFGLAALAAALVVWAVGAPSTLGFAARFAGAVGAGAAAFAVRQTAAGALVAVAVGVGVGLLGPRADRSNRRFERSVAGALLAVAGAVCIAVYRWRSTMQLGGAADAPWDLERVTMPLVDLDRFLVSVSVLLLPVSVAFVRRDLLRRRVQARPRLALVSGVGLGFIAVLNLGARPLDQFTLGDYVTQFGSSHSSAPSAVVPILPWLVWALVLAAACANLWVLLLVLTGPGLRRCWQQRPVVVAVAAALIVTGTVMLVLGWVVTYHVYDRYLLLSVPFAGLLVAWVTVADGPADAPDPAPLALRGAPAWGLAGLVVLAAWFGVASASFDRAVHDAGDRALVVTGAAFPDLHGGMTVNGANAADAPLDQPLERNDGYRCWVVRQTDRRSQVDGPVVGHRRLLWVDRWFYLEQFPKYCDGDQQPGG